jgi:8-oxo-dGTP diphosphatase
MEHPTHIVAVMGIVSNSDGQVLLIKSPRRGWEPPGGQVENGEDILTALKREIMEESGIVVETGKLVARYSNGGSHPTKFMLTFEAKVVDGELHTSPESMEAGWFSPEEAVDRVTHPAQRQKLQDALVNAKGIIYRVYETNPYRLLRTVII